jgi:hypothetical protein
MFLQIMSVKQQDVDFDFNVPSNQGSYEGETNDFGQKHGFGEIKYDDGSHYKGNWENDMYHGQGTYSMADGTVLTGNWLEGKLEG